MDDPLSSIVGRPSSSVPATLPKRPPEVHAARGFLPCVRLPGNLYWIFTRQPSFSNLRLAEWRMMGPVSDKRRKRKHRMNALGPDHPQAGNPGASEPRSSPLRRPGRSRLGRSRHAAPPAEFLNRDLSWLEFNRRVLHEALDERTPLLERLKFLGICASNLDEFFMKRVGWVKRRLEEGALPRTPEGVPAHELLAAFRHQLLPMVAQQSRVLLESPAPETRGGGHPPAEMGGAHARRSAPRPRRSSRPASSRSSRRWRWTPATRSRSSRISPSRSA